MKAPALTLTNSADSHSDTEIHFLNTLDIPVIRWHLSELVDTVLVSEMIEIGFMDTPDGSFIVQGITRSHGCDVWRVLQYSEGVKKIKFEGTGDHCGEVLLTAQFHRFEPPYDDERISTGHWLNIVKRTNNRDRYRATPSGTPMEP